MADVLSESRPISDGEARCDLCGQRIPRGTQYTRTTLAEYREIWDWRECAPCQDVARYVQKWWDGEENFGPEQAIDWAWEACHGAATSRHELLTALRFRWRYWHGRPRWVTVSRAILRQYFKPERKAR